MDGAKFSVFVYFLIKIGNTDISRIRASIATSKQGKNITRKEKKKKGIFRVYQLRNESLGLR